MVIPLKRRATQQPVRRVASLTGSYAQSRNTSLRALPMTTGIGRGSRLVSEIVHTNAAHVDVWHEFSHARSVFSDKTAD